MNASKNRMQTRTTYDRLSGWYDLLSNPAEGRARQKAISLLDVQTDDLILEIGCGTGNSSIEMGGKVKSGGYVYALDLSPKMLKVAHMKHQRQGFLSRTGFFCGDAISLPFPAHSLTGILISFTLELFTEDEILIILSDCRRILRRGGRLCVLSMSKWQPNARMLKPYEWLHEHMPAWFDCRPILLHKTLEQNGFRIIDDRRSSLFGLPIETVLAEPLT